MSSLMDAVDRHDRRPGRKCSIGLMIATLTPEQSIELDEVFRKPQYSAGTITDAIKDTYGQSVGASNVQRHRRGDCNCERP